MQGGRVQAQSHYPPAKSVHMRFVHSRCKPRLFLGGYGLDRRCDFRGIIELGELVLPWSILSSWLGQSPCVRKRSRRTRRKSLLWCALTSGWAVGLVLLLTSYTAAAQVTLGWDASVSMVDGYWLYDGTVSGSYSARIDVGTATTYTITGLVGGQTYYFAVTAYDRTDNVESPFSNEVSLTLPSTQPPPAGGGTETAPGADADGAQGRGTQLTGGGGGCTLNPGAGCDPLVLGMIGLWSLWFAARVWTRVKRCRGITRSERVRSDALIVQNLGLDHGVGHLRPLSLTRQRACWHIMTLQ